MNKRRFTEKQNEITRKSNKKKALENRIARIDDDADLWDESICRTNRKGRRFDESAFDTAMLYLRVENDKIDRIGSSIVFNSQMNERLAQKMDKRGFELIKHNAEGLLKKECNELVERLNSLISYCDDAIDAVDQN